MNLKDRLAAERYESETEPDKWDGIKIEDIKVMEKKLENAKSRLRYGAYGGVSQQEWNGIFGRKK